MTPPTGTRLETYARAVEKGWSTFIGEDVVLSPRDFERIRDWHTRGVPLQLIEEAIAAAASRRRRRPPRGLGYLAEAVEESWSAIRDDASAEGAGPEPAPSAAATRQPGAFRGSRVVTPEPAGQPDDQLQRNLERWSAVRDGAPEGSTLRELLEKLLAALGAGEPPETVDRALDLRIEEALAPDLVAEIGITVDRELAPFRARMPADTWEPTRRKAIRARLRRRLGLPSLQ